MYYEPLPHQVEDSDHMLQYEVAYLWADAGTGKTITAMEAIRKGGFEKVVVICPKMAITMWKEELEKHLEEHSRIGNKKYCAMAIRSTTSWPKGRNIHYNDAIIMPFGVARNTHKAGNWLYGIIIRFQVGHKSPSHPDARPWDNRYKTAVIIDEAHNLKSKSAKQTLAIFGTSIDKNQPNSMLHGVTSVYMLTGTPVMRYFDDLWTQLRVGRAEIMRYFKVWRYDDFVREYCRVEWRAYGNGPKKKVVTGNTNKHGIKKLLEHCDVIRRKLNDVVADLPPISHRIIDTEYKSVPAGGIGKMSQTDLISALSKEDSEASTIRRKLGLAKVPSIIEYIEEYGQKPYLIGFWHKDVGAELFERLGGTGYAIVDGATPSKRRDMIREQFNAGELHGIIGQMQAMNTSWNLQDVCKHVIIAEELLSPAMLHQFYSRVYRRGQKNHVQVDHMLSTHSLDTALRGIRLVKAANNEKVGV